MNAIEETTFELLLLCTNVRALCGLELKAARINGYIRQATIAWR